MDDLNPGQRVRVHTPHATDIDGRTGTFVRTGRLACLPVWRVLLDGDDITTIFALAELEPLEVAS
jgi:hypothetical protein